MKHTTRNEVSDMIFEANAKLSRDLTATLTGLANTARLSREQDSAATVKLVEATYDNLKQYVRDMTKFPTLSPNQVPPIERAVESPPLYRSNDELAHKAGFAKGQELGFVDGHAAALTKVIELLGNNPRYMSHATLKRAVDKLAL